MGNCSSGRHDDVTAVKGKRAEQRASTTQIYHSPKSLELIVKAASNFSHSYGSGLIGMRFKYQKDTSALEYWEPMKEIGEGSISSIYLVKRRPHRIDVPYQERMDIMSMSDCERQLNTITDTDEICALKSIIKGSVADRDMLDEMRNEIYTMSHLSHPNIAHIVEAFEKKRHIFLVMEYCRGGNLSRRKFNEAQTATVIRKVLSGLAYLHRKGEDRTSYSSCCRLRPLKMFKKVWYIGI